ncbi:transposase [Erwinia tracheiphila]|uniref:Transposase n=1 Tax=Erwinia tracheiphila TaxID=65700 RepID=A0A0M2KDA5_9GAMM|nr:transposase [Erwinia tracheiphila]
MDEKQSQALANELDKNLKTPDDLSQFERLLKKSVSGRRSTPK